MVAFVLASSNESGPLPPGGEDGDTTALFTFLSSSDRAPSDAALGFLVCALIFSLDTGSPTSLTAGLALAGRTLLSRSNFAALLSLDF